MNESIRCESDISKAVAGRDVSGIEQRNEGK